MAKKSTTSRAKCNTIEINRVPVLTLWAAIVAQRLGFEWNEALTLGQCVAGMNAYSKGKALGLFAPKSSEIKKKRTAMIDGEKLTVDLLGRAVPCVQTDAGLRAVNKGKTGKPEAVEKYLEGKFGESLDDVRTAMTALAKSRPPRELADVAFALYETFRPAVPPGTRGWGAKGTLDLKKIAKLSQ